VEMDEGYVAQDYYRAADCRIALETDRGETSTYANYGWTEHISRKWGQWEASPENLLGQLAKCGFRIPRADAKEAE
jgi:hypothetical protein